MVSPYPVVPAGIEVIWPNFVPSVERSILNPVSLFELSVQCMSMRLDDLAAAVRLLGAVGVGVGVGVGDGLGEGMGVGVGDVVGVGVGVGLGVGEGVGVGVGVGVGEAGAV